MGQTRRYQVSNTVSKPAGAAVATKEEEDDYPVLPSMPAFKPPENKAPPPPPKRTPGAPNPYLLMPDWRCTRCEHVNLPNVSQCPICETPRQPNAQIHYSHRDISHHPIKPQARDIASHRQDRGQASTGGYNFSIFGSGRDGRASPGADARVPKHSQSIRKGVSAKPTPLIRYSHENQRDPPKKPLNDEQVYQMNIPDRTSEYRTRRFGQSEKPSSPDPLPAASRTPVTGPTRSNEESFTDTSSGSFMPFVRKMKPKEVLESTGSPATTLEEGLTSGASPTALDPATPTAFMPPASSSFDNFVDERRKKRQVGQNRRSERYEINDPDESTTQQSSTSRDRTPKTLRGPQHNIDDEFMDDDFGEGRKKLGRKPKLRMVRSKPTLHLPDFISVEQLARVLKVRIDPFLRKLEEEGFDGARYDHLLDAESSAMVADTYGFEASFGGRQTFEDLVSQPVAEDRSVLPPRPPVVTIMGHVDHGKTTILDWLRKSSVVASEHGGITQHIGAFSVTMPGSERQITFLDTPGHAAFLDMRKRGAVVTDIVVLVVAADDSVKPQTVEAIKHALEAKVHIIVAINKVDKEDSNVDRVKQDLARHDIAVEDYGGEYQAIALSGKTGQGMADLEEAILTLADVSDFRAETDGQAEGWILESKVTQAGRVATILVRRGTLRVGDFIVAGTTWGRVKTLRNDAGVLVDEALPGTPVQVDGWRGEDPTAGLEVLQAENEEHAKDVVDIRLESLESLRMAGDLAAMNVTRSEEAEARSKVLAWEAEQTWAKKKRKPADNEGWIEGAASKGPKHVHFVVKADVAGSVEALVAAVSAVGNNEIRANIIHSGAGVLSESDIRHLTATGETAYAISFNQPIDGTVAQLARAAGLQILDHNIIYKVTDDVKEKLAAELPLLITQRVLGEAEIGKVFEISTKQGKVKIAGCRISNGSISRSHKIRVLRDGETVYTGKVGSLKNVKKDVTEMRKGNECGMGFSDWEDFQEGDQVQTFEEESSPRKLY